jgi:alanyl-tRNA synthetase
VLAEVEQQINEVALADLEVTAFVTTQDEARRMGAMALFGEKYGDRVRVVEVGDYARELCGGTHAARSGQLGMIKLLSEGSIGSGVRRVEGLVGLDAYSWSAREHVLLAQVAAAFKVPADEVPERVASTVARLREVEKELAQLRAGQVLQQAGAFAAAAQDLGGVAWVGVEAPAGTPGDLVRSLALDVRGRIAADRPTVVLVARAASAPPWWRRSTTPAGRGGCPPTRCCARPLRAWTARAAARTTSHRARDQAGRHPDALARARDMVRRTASA